MFDAVWQSAAAAAAAAAERASSTASTDAERTLLGRVARQSGAVDVRLRGRRSRQRRPTRQQARHHCCLYVLDEMIAVESAFIVGPSRFTMGVDAFVIMINTTSTSATISSTSHMSLLQ